MTWTKKRKLLVNKNAVEPRLNLYLNTLAFVPHVTCCTHLLLFVALGGNLEHTEIVD